MHLLLLLVLGTAAMPAAPESADTDETRAVVVRGINAFDATLAKSARIFANGPGPGADAPITGLLLDSDEEPGPDGFHAVTVHAVLIGGPADAAGILPGDRILAIGPRRMEHETVQVVRLLLEGRGGPATLTIGRNGGTTTVVVHRAPLPCMHSALVLTNPVEWQAKVAGLKKASGMLRNALDDPSLPASERYVFAHQQLQQLFVMLNGATEQFYDKWATAQSQTCPLKLAQQKEAQ